MQQVVAGILLNPQDEVLIAERPAGKIYAGYWEFPGGKIEAGEAPVQALVRELREELGIDTAAENWTPFYRGCRSGEVALTFFLAHSRRHYQPQGLEQQRWCWSPLSALAGYRFPEPNTEVLSRLSVLFFSKELL